MTKGTSNFRTLLSSAIKHVITSEDIVAYDDNFVLAITTNKRLVYLSSINDISMLYVEANDEPFSLPFEPHNQMYSVIVSGISSNFVLISGDDNSMRHERLNTGFITYLIPENVGYTIQHPAQKNGCLNLMLLNEDMADFKKLSAKKEKIAPDNVVDFLRKEFDYQIGDLLRQLRESLNKDRLDYVIYQSYMFQFYAAYLLRFHKAQSQIEDRKFSKLDIKVAKAAALIEGDLKTYQSVADIALRVGINHVSLQRGFKANLGLTINEFVRQKRLAKAVELLRTTELNISEIVYKIGLNSQSYFSEIFRREYGMTPRKFREVYRTTEGRNLVFKNIDPLIDL